MTPQQINKIYDSFEKKEMSREEFHKAYARLMDPATMKADFARICHQRHEKKTIDRAVRGG